MREKYVQFYLQFFLLFSNCIYIYIYIYIVLFLFPKWVLILFQSLEYVPSKLFIYYTTRNEEDKSNTPMSRDAKRSNQNP